MKKLNSRGFSHIEAFIVVVVVALIGAIGFYVWQRSSNNNPDSSAETVVSPVPVYRLTVEFPDSSLKLNYYDWAVGTEEMLQKVDEGNGFVVNDGVAFMAYPQSVDKNLRKADPVYYLTATGAGKRLDGKYEDVDVKTSVFTTSKSTKDVLVAGGGYLGDGFDDSGVQFRAYKSAKAGNVKIYRLWKTVTKTGRRNYVYTDKTSSVATFKRQGYHQDSEYMYGPSSKDSCETRVDGKYGRICDPKTTTPPTNNRGLTKVLDEAAYGQVFACKINNNFYKGIKFKFRGENAKSLRVKWSTSRSNGNGSGLGAAGNLPLATRANRVISSGDVGVGTVPPQNTNVWTFNLKNKSNQIKRSDNIEHKNLKTCNN